MIAVVRRAGACTAIVLVGCGGAKAKGAEPVAKPVTIAASASASASPTPSPRSGRLRRSQVMAALSSGMGAFLARLAVEPAMQNGRFRGWRIIKLADRDPMWQGTDLVVGDVITRVNGRTIEHPEEALAVFQSLAVAKELRVTLERNGKSRELSYPIDDEPASANAAERPTPQR